MKSIMTMICRTHETTNTAKVNTPLAIANNDTNLTHRTLMQRVPTSAEIALRIPVDDSERVDAITERITNQINGEFRASSTLLPSSSTPTTSSLTQRLQTAQTEWKKIFSRRRADQGTSSLSTPSSQRNVNNPAQPIPRPSVMTAENHRANTSWGDPLLGKSASTTRIYSLNVNGLSLDRRGGKFDELCKVMKEVQADVLCCQEHCLDTTRPNVRNILHDTARQHWARTRITYGNTPTPFLTDHKPGGTMIVSSGDITGRFVSHSEDRWGRWISQTVRGTGSTYVTIVSAYQVVTDNPYNGLTTAASQQRSLLLQTGDTEQRPRKAFKRDLSVFLTERISRGEEILLVGDFNEVFGSELDGMSQIAADLRLVNLMQVRHHQLPPATYSRGKKCLDYGLATNHVAQALRSCGYEAFNERFPTDHRAYFFDFDTDVLLVTKPKHWHPRRYAY
jgi:exonuclease III